MDNLIKNGDHYPWVKHIITPIAPYFICDYYYSTEVYKNDKKYINAARHLGPDTLKLIINDKNDLFLNGNLNKIKEGDIILVQVDLFEDFINKILPSIKCKIVLFTSQYHYPQLHKNELTEKIINDDKIILWISQNPIYNNHKKYMAFPYGMSQNKVDKYMEYVKKNYHNILNIDTKKNYCYNSNHKCHDHLPENHIRRHPIFKNKSHWIEYNMYLNEILKSKFTISTGGDRDDCFRHYECIGLNSVPISNISYEEIFGKNMIKSDINDLIKIVNDDKIIDYNPPNRDIITMEYWRNQIKLRLRK